jgi:(2Fe-2S) ferredoxin
MFSSASTSAKTEPLAAAATARPRCNSTRRRESSRWALNGEGKIRINKAGCLDRCDAGPCVVVYPEGVWYTYVDEQDIDEIIESHLVKGEIVERLRI